MALTGCSQVTATIGADAVREVVPTGYSSGVGAYAIAWHHGAGGSAADLATNDADSVAWWQPLINAGLIMFASDAAGNNWGNTAGLTAYAAHLTRLRSTYNILGIVILAGSMGGFSSLLCAINGTYSDLLGMYLVYPGCSLANIWNNGFGQSPDLSGSIASAYGISNGSQYAANTSGHDPLLYAASSFPRVPYRFIHSYSDVTIPRVENTDALQTLLRTRSPGVSESDTVTSTGVHGDASNLVPADLLAFVRRCIDPRRVAWRSV